MKGWEANQRANGEKGKVILLSDSVACLPDITNLFPLFGQYLARSTYTVLPDKSKSLNIVR